MEGENRDFHADSMQKHHGDHDLEANILDGGETLYFMPTNNDHDDHQTVNPEDSEALDEERGIGDEECCDSEELSVYSSPALESLHSDEEDQEGVGQEEIPPRRDPDSSYHYGTSKNDPTSTRTMNHNKSSILMDNNIHEGKNTIDYVP